MNLFEIDKQLVIESIRESTSNQALVSKIHRLVTAGLQMDNIVNLM